MAKPQYRRVNTGLSQLIRQDGKSGSYYIKYRDEDGKSVFRSLKTTSIREAERKQREILYGVELAKKNIARVAGGDKLLADFQDEYLAHRRTVKSAKTVSADNYGLSRFIVFAGNLHLSEVTKAQINDWVGKLKADDFSPSTIDQHIRVMRRAYNWAIENGYITTNPFVKIERPRIVPSERAEALTPDQVEALLSEVQGTHWESMVKFLLWTGCRRGEALTLQGRDVDNERKLILIRAEKSKSKRNREIPFGSKQNLLELMESLRCEPDRLVFRSTHPNGSDGWSVDAISRYLKKIYKRIDAPWASTHTLRHTFASHLLMSGVPVWTVSQLLGHSTVVITEQTYAHVIPQHTEDAMSRLPF